MSYFIETYREEQMNVEYCVYCNGQRQGRQSCCGEAHFVQFRDMDDDTQQRMAIEEYESHHPRGLK